MPPSKIIISKAKLIHLYHEKRLNPYEIGDLLHCSFKTVTNRMHEHGIQFRTPAAARMRYPKHDFNGSILDKAYIMGFRIGDLNVYRPGKTSETIVVRCHTTQQEQVDVMHSLFGPFGKFTVSSKAGHYNVNCFLNTSFDFLLSKSVDSWEWIKKDRKTCLAFIAGYNDAEGNFIINQGRARFKIDSYDKEVLEWMSLALGQMGIENKYRRIYKMGDVWNGTSPLTKDLWRINVNDATALERFIIMQLDYLRHRTRIKDANVCLKNISKRRDHGSIK